MQFLFFRKLGKKVGLDKIIVEMCMRNYYS